MVSMSEVLRVIMDDKSLSLFDTIAFSSANSDIIINRLGLTKKQYYPRIYELRKAGLIRKSNTKYRLTSFGKVVYEAQKLIGKGMQNYWKLKAIDSIESVEISTDERDKIIDTIIETEEIKNILINHGSTTISKC
jgi:predicted transcriptional regulator